MEADSDNRFALVLGAAVIDLWGDLPQDVQHTLFEAAVAAGPRIAALQDGLRERLAVFLHDRHPRTQ